MSVKALSGFLDRLKMAIRCHVCAVCQAVPAQSHIKLVCERCEERVFLRHPIPALSLTASQVYAACEFPGIVKKMVYRYKFDNKRDNAITMAEILIHYWYQVPARDKKSWVVVPIPSHSEKRDNHLTPIFQLFASEFGYQYMETGLQWNRDIQPQHTILNKRRRRINIHGALQVTPQFESRIKSGSRVLIVDDLLTSGSTMVEAISAFERSNLKIDMLGLTFAHVPMGISRPRSLV